MLQHIERAERRLPARAADGGSARPRPRGVPGHAHLAGHSGQENPGKRPREEAGGARGAKDRAKPEVFASARGSRASEPSGLCRPTSLSWSLIQMSMWGPAEVAHTGWRRPWPGHPHSTCFCTTRDSWGGWRLEPPGQHGALARDGHLSFPSRESLASSPKPRAAARGI